MYRPHRTQLARGGSGGRAGRRFAALAVLAAAACASTLGTTGAAAHVSPQPERPGLLRGPSSADVHDPPAAVSTSSRPHADDTALEKETGLRVTIETVKPVALTPRQDLRLEGVVNNADTEAWKDAQVYLDIESEPAASRETLTALHDTTEGFGTRLVEIGLFDEIGKLKRDSTTAYALSVPFGKLPISGANGVYHVGVTVIAGDHDGSRMPVAQADTLMPLLPEVSGQDDPLPRTGVVTLIPLAAPVRRLSTGSFLDDDLATSIAYGGQLRNLLDFIAAAPADSLEVVLDPALRQAVADMAGGYTVRSTAEVDADEPGHPGQGSAEAQKWLADLDEAVRGQDLLFMPWGSPDVSGLGAHNLPGVVEAAVRASQRYASDQRITTTIASWPYNGATTRRGLAVAALADAPLRLVSEASLTNLREQPDSSYPPSQVLVPTALGQITALVTRSDVAGDEISLETSGQQLLQDIVAEATVRSLDDEPTGTSVVAVPFGWDPGVETSKKDLATAYEFTSVRPRTAAMAVQETAVRYPGPILMPESVDTLPTEVFAAVLQLRNKGRTFTDLLTHRDSATQRFDETLAAAGSSVWRDDPVDLVYLVGRATRQSAHKTGKVSVTGPTFVALSSGSGRFPLTVTNRLDVRVTVQVVVRAANPAVTVDPIDRLVLDPGQRRDIDATARSDGSGLTGVQVRLTTTTRRPVGTPFMFDIRSTQIGVAIWIVMGLGGAVLFGAAGRRIYLRVKQGRLQTRAESSQ